MASLSELQSALAEDPSTHHYCARIDRASLFNPQVNSTFSCITDKVTLHLGAIAAITLSLGKKHFHYRRK